MTEWQWQVIIALCKITVKQHKNEKSTPELNLLTEAIHREDIGAFEFLIEQSRK